MTALKTVVASIGISLLIFCVGCGVVAIPESSPSISQVLPRTVAAGTQRVTMTVVGTNFSSDAVVLWNGNTLSTSVVNGSTLAAPVSGSNLATPAVVQLVVQDRKSGNRSNPVNVTITSQNSGSSSGPTVLPLTIVTSSLSAGTVGVAYNAGLSAAGGTLPYTWSVTSGQLPPGVSLDSSNGALIGTPSASGRFSFTVEVKDASSPAQTATANIKISVNAKTTGGAGSTSGSGSGSGSGAGSSVVTVLSASSPSLPGGLVGKSYSATLNATGGSAPYTWSLASGQLPQGLSLASSGVISGVPAASGTFNFTATVTDAGNPAQKASVSASITVAASTQTSRGALTIDTLWVPAGSIGTNYSAALQASGGTPGYTWSITAGGLPAGLVLGASTGAISGTPTTSGTSTFTLTVTDSSNPAQTASVNLSISITAAATPGGGLAITTASLPSGTDGTAYSTQLQASGGTPGYTWSIASGSLPAGLTLGASTGVISGTPTATGTSNFTVAISDASSPAQANSLAESITVAAATAAPSGPGTTWYVRPDGGTRYSSNMTSGQCDGKGDAAYPGSGVNQHCAFSDFRYLYQDGSYTNGSSFPGWGWVIAGGDTVIVRGSIGSGVTYRVGSAPPSQTSYCDAKGVCWGIAGDTGDSSNPPIPAGTASQHTRILGENFASCSAQSARTQLHGGSGVYIVLNLTNTSYVDVQCLDITDFSNCGISAGTCTSTSDKATFGIKLYSNATNITLQDLRIHGLASAGIWGPPGTGFVANDLAIVGNGSAGWNADPGDGTTGVGTLNVTNFNISWNGCDEEYPIVDAVPYAYCRDDATGGYGDGFGTTTVPSPAPGWQIHFDQGIVSYNTQDGLDSLHVNGPGTSVTYTRVLAFGNEGQQLKAGASETTIQNSLIVGNCAAILQTIPGRPSTTNDKLGDTCRAGNTAVAFVLYPGHPAIYQNNTLITDGSIGVEADYATADHGSTNTMQYNNNIFIGTLNSASGEYPSPIYSVTDMNMLTNPGGSFSHNDYIGQKWTCPLSIETNAICTDPGLVDEALHAYGYGNMAPSSSSSAVAGAGVAIPAITLDYNGGTRPNPPSIGALEP